MDVLVLIDRLEELVEDARSFPGFGNTAMVDRDAAFDIIDQMRQTIPEELKQARWIVKERQAMLDEARSESDRIIRSAQDEAEKITSEEEVLKRAEKRSAEIMEDARRRERDTPRRRGLRRRGPRQFGGQPGQAPGGRAAGTHEAARRPGTIASSKLTS